MLQMMRAKPTSPADIQMPRRSSITTGSKVVRRWSRVANELTRPTAACMDLRAQRDVTATGPEVCGPGTTRARTRS